MLPRLMLEACVHKQDKTLSEHSTHSQEAAVVQAPVKLLAHRLTVGPSRKVHTWLREDYRRSTSV